MFQFNGWVVIRIWDYDDPPPAINKNRMAEAETAVRHALNEVDDNFSSFEFKQAGNDLWFVTVNGLRNHRYQPVIDFFGWVANNLPEAYGLLYVWDDEDKTQERGDFSNCFRVWRLARGRLTEEDDPFLSPCIPTIEPPFPTTIVSIDAGSLIPEKVKELELLIGVQLTLETQPSDLQKRLGPPSQVFEWTSPRVEYQYILAGKPQRRARFLFDRSSLISVTVEEPASP